MALESKTRASLPPSRRVPAILQGRVSQALDMIRTLETLN
jgi:hypothetical protein